MTTQETEALKQRVEQLEAVCSQAYAALGSIYASFKEGEEPVELDNLLINLEEGRVVHENVLPFPTLKVLSK